jgi:hypothetical protein
MRPSVIRTIRRRSIASASAPPTKAVSIRATNSTAPRAPTAAVEPVKAYSWYGTAT